MNFVQEVLNLLVRKQNKDKLELTRDWFEFGRTKTSRLATPAYSPKMTPHAIRYDDLKCNIISGLVEGTGTEHTLPMWSTVNENNCSVQTIVDSIFSQDPGASEGLVSGHFRVTGNTVLEGDLLVLGTQTIVESTVVQIADNIFRINSTAAPLDAGIEVIVPQGTKQFFFRQSDQYWTLDGESLDLHNIRIHHKLEFDGEDLVNVVNEAEGLASNDNDQSLATVAAIKDYVDNQASDYVDDVQLIGNSLQFTAIGNAFSGLVDLSQFLDNTDTIDYVSDVILNGSSLDFTGVGNGFNGSIDLSHFAVDTNTTYDLEGVANIANGVDIRLVGSDSTVDAVTFNPGSNIAFTDLGGGVFEIAASGSSGMALSDIVAGDKINVSINGAQQTVTVSHQTTTTTPTTSTQGLTYGTTFDAIVDVTHDAYGHITGYDTRTFTMPLSSGGTSYTAGAGLDLNGTEFSLTDVIRTNSSSTASPAHTGTFTVIDDLTTNAKGQVTAVNVKTVTLPASGTGADGVITNVTFDSNTSVLDFTGSNGGFNGSINLASLATTETLTSLSRSNNLLLYSDENGNVTNVDLSDYNNPDQNLWANIAVAGQQTITANTTTDTLEFVAGAGIQLQTNTVQKKVFITNTVTNTNDIDYISDVALNGTNLDFTAVGNAFAGSIDLSSFLDDTNATYTLGLAAGGSNDTVVTLTGAGGGASSQFTIAGGAGITVVENLSTNTIAISSTITDTNTTYDLLSAQAGNDVEIRLAGSDATTDALRLAAGSNITLNDNGTGTITIDAAGGGASYIFGTYLTETSGTVNHDATTRSDSTSTAAPAHGATFTAVDSVTTNATGHVTGINVKTVTLPDGVVSCSYGDQWTGTRTINSTTYNDIIANGAQSLGIQNVAGKVIDVTISWTIQIGDIVGAGTHGFNTRLEHFDQGGNSVGTIIEWKDSQTLSAEYPACRTYTATVNDLADQHMLIVQIAKPTAGAPDFDLQQAAISVNITACDGDTGGGYAQAAVRA